MRARTKRLPGQPGTKALMKIYGERLVCVRYRYDREQRKRYKTAEIIVEEAPWQPPALPPAADTIVYLRVAVGEVAIRLQVKSAGGQWHPKPKLWAIRYAEAKRLKLLDRMVELEVE